MSDQAVESPTAMASKKSSVTFTNEDDRLFAPIETSTSSSVDQKQENPQEAYSPPRSPVMGDENKAPKRNASRKGWKRRKKGRHVRVADVEEEVVKSKRLPASQYEIVLRRRAIRKEEIKRPTQVIVPSPSRRGIFGGSPRVSATNVTKDVKNGYDEDVGDTSLGMKLNIIGGRVIVQVVNALADGRASPAQLTGLVQRGDVLVAVDGKSIVNLPIDQLVSGLNPLSKPQDDGTYKRVLKLRFAAGEGLEILKKNEEKASKGVGPDVFNLAQFLPNGFPIADQLSGMPIFEEQLPASSQHKLLEPVIATPLGYSQEEKTDINKLNWNGSLSLNELISLGVADLMRDEKERFTSEFFAWSEHYSELLRPSIVLTIKAGEDEITAFLDKKEMIDRGQEAMKGAKLMLDSMEDIDKGKDLRSFKAWSSNASLRSRASTRRRYIMDASVIGSTIAEEVDSDANVSVGSDELDEMDGLDGDELLMQLAAHDEIWRKQVLETIEIATKQMEDGKDEEEVMTNKSHEIDIAESLGSLFLGEQVHNLLTKKKRTFALPPDEVTQVLFDLVTHLACTTPDEISVKGKFEINPQTSLVPFQRSKISSVDKDALLATLFVVHDVFPAWLKSFKPLPWEERRVLWPFTKASNMMESTAGGSLADDLLTVDSPGEHVAPVLKKKKNLRETIEDMELDLESRAEACYLITFFFTQELLPGIVANGSSWRSKRAYAESDALDFVDKYGAYLKLPMSLAYASFLRSETVVVKLLDLAKHDPRHLEALKDISRSNTFVLYEPTMLSAIAKSVRQIEKQKPDGRSHLVHLAVSAFPDLRPWLVRKGCLEGIQDTGKRDQKNLEELYYLYLSLLLHPTDGHEGARQDGDLVKEWCEMSTVGDGVDDTVRRSRRGNFLGVASRKQHEHKAYYRDLSFLMELAMKVKEITLALDLMEEILDHKVHVNNEELMSNTITHLRFIATSSLADPTKSKPMHVPRLKKVFRLFEKISSVQALCGIKDAISVSEEYDNIIAACSDDERVAFLELMSSHADPVYTLQSLRSWSSEHKSNTDFLPLLHMSLKRSSQLQNRNELSAALIRIQRARSTGSHEITEIEEETEGYGRGMIWRLMISGELQIDK